MKTCTCNPSPLGDSLVRKADGYYCPVCGGKRAYFINSYNGERSSIEDYIKKHPKIEEDK